MLNKEIVLNHFEFLIRKYCDFKNLTCNITINHNIMKKFAKKVSKSLTKMNYQENYHTKISAKNIQNIDEMHNIKNKIFENNSILNKHIKICKKFLGKKQKEINQIKWILNIKEKGSMENLLNFFENIFKLNKLNSINFEKSENFFTLRNIYDDIENLCNEITCHSSIIIEYYNYYLSINFKLQAISNTPLINNSNRTNKISIKNSFKIDDNVNYNNYNEFLKCEKIINNKFDEESFKNKKYIKLQNNTSNFSFNRNKSNNPLKTSFNKNNYSIKFNKKINNDRKDSFKSNFMIINSNTIKNNERYYDNNKKFDSANKSILSEN